ncbi:MAG: peptidoglycan editing factor PgeF [Acidobacteriota bacterium]
MRETDFPPPSDSFRWVRVGGRGALVCRALEAAVTHLFTTRAWRLGAGDDTAGWAEIADAVAVGPDHLVHVRQVHGADVVVRHAGDSRSDDPPADILVSDDPASALAIQTADCVPLLVADVQTGAVAAAHAGWRGLAVRVPGAAVEALGREFGSRPENLLVAVGPAIGACCYEVGTDVRQRFEDAAFPSGAVDAWFFRAPRPSPQNPPMADLPGAPRAGHWYFDGAAAARDQLLAAGVPSARIYLADLCTASHPAALCSYRRDGAGAGRLVAAIRSGRGRAPR